jgi:hypothetical protein
MRYYYVIVIVVQDTQLQCLFTASHEKLFSGIWSKLIMRWESPKHVENDWPVVPDKKSSGVWILEQAGFPHVAPENVVFRVSG